MALGILAVLAAAAVFWVARSLGRSTVEAFAPTPPEPTEVGLVKQGPVSYTVDATSEEAWTYFDFSRASVVRDPAPSDWDLAFQRFRVIANGGPGFDGEGGILDLGARAFDSVVEVPEAGYAGTEVRGDSVNPAIERWYEYGWSTHLLEPKRHVYAVRTADGRFAKLEILGYYCPGSRGGCLRFRYVYQGAGGTDVSTSIAAKP